MMGRTRSVSRRRSASSEALRRWCRLLGFSAVVSWSGRVDAGACPNPGDASKPGACIPRPPPAADDVPDVNALRAPETPAFHALGLASEDVQRPTTPFPTTLAVASGLAAGKVIVPFQNLGVQFAPYWMKRRPDVTREFMEEHQGWAWFRNFTVSFALTQHELDVADDAGNVTREDTALGAIGARTTLWPGEPSDVAMECQRFLIERSQQDAIAVQEDQTRRLKRWEAENPRPRLEDYSVPGEPSVIDPKYTQDGTFDEQQYRRDVDDWTKRREAQFVANNGPVAQWDRERQQFKDQALDDYNRAHPIVETEAKARCRRLIHERRGFVVDVAAAHAVRAPNGDLRRRDEVTDGGQTSSEWATLGLLGQHLSALLVVRLRQVNGDPSDTADSGARLTAAWSRFGLSVEGTHRYLLDATADEHQYRLALGFDYRLDGGMWVRTVVGKDFDTPDDDVPVIAMANLQWNFGLDRGITPDRIGGGQ